ncbi:hypothetical protein K523DRAFT_409738 [Schizophyllum commune Tattone D]|nr:hypothetical protein K523DRAFT_409738 [Schizophyllum commune Tattone D]
MHVPSWGKPGWIGALCVLLVLTCLLARQDVVLPSHHEEIVAELLMPPLVSVLRVFNTSHDGHLGSERSRSFSCHDVTAEHENRVQDIQVAVATFQTLDADRMVDPMRVTLEVIELRFAKMAVKVSSSDMEHERPLADLLARLSSDSGICAQGLQRTWTSVHLVLNLVSDVAGVSAETEAPWFSAAGTSEADPSMATVRFVHDQLTRQISEYRHSLACLADLRDGLLSVQLHSSQLREELYSAILLNSYRDLLLACLGFKTVNMQLQEHHISAMQKTSDDAWAMDTMLIQLRHPKWMRRRIEELPTLVVDINLENYAYLQLVESQGFYKCRYVSIVGLGRTRVGVRSVLPKLTPPELLQQSSSSCALRCIATGAWLLEKWLRVVRGDTRTLGTLSGSEYITPEAPSVQLYASAVAFFRREAEGDWRRASLYRLIEHMSGGYQSLKVTDESEGLALNIVLQGRPSQRKSFGLSITSWLKMVEGYPAKRLKTYRPGAAEHRPGGRPSLRSILRLGRAAFHPPVRRRNVLRPDYIPITGDDKHVADELPHKTPHPAQDSDLDITMGDATVHSTGTSRPPLYRGTPSLPARGSARSAAIYRFGPRLDPRILHRHRGPRFGAVGRERKELRLSPPPGHATGNGANVETAGPRNTGAKQQEPLPSTSHACNGDSGSGGGGADDEDDEEDGRGRIVSVQRHPLPGEGSRSSISTPPSIHNEPMAEPDAFEAAFEEIDQEENVAGPSKYTDISDDEEQADPLPVGPSRLGIVLQTARSGRTRKAKTTTD